MFTRFAKALFGDHNERLLKNLRPLVAVINGLEPAMQALSDDALRGKTNEFRTRLAAGEALDKLLPEAFAVVREASRRVLGMRHFDVQLIGGMVLHHGKISEMKTGEGKTLVATLPVYLNALAGKGVHVVTVNDYLARRDADWMGQIYTFLGMTYGVIVHGLDDAERRVQYGCDITYGTNNEYGFDYLRDNMKYSLDDMVQRPFHYAIVDEVDSILIDEARTPLIISGPAEDSSALYREINKVIPQLTADDYEKDEKHRTIVLNDSGVEKIEKTLRDTGAIKDGHLYDIQNVTINHHVMQALRAHTLYARDVDYIVKDDKVIIIDEFTGRMMPGRRFSEGLHQALEAKEQVTVEQENQTLASITYQNFFRLYPKLSGMTGTAGTEAAEFAEIYGLEVVEIPTNVPVQRRDDDDLIYRTAREKYNAIIDLINECRERGQPVLVGTTSIEKSELISELLKKRKIPHNVLNARHHEQEAFIVSQAGRAGAITVATNMAGRGTDIKLGGNLEMRVLHELADISDESERARRAEKIASEIETTKSEVLAAGGLVVVGTERHESRRIDNQLRGRGGRQGDPGASRFFVSLEDDLMRIFGAQRLDGMLQRLGLKEGEAIYHPWINKAMQKAQQRVEALHFDIRKNLLKYDDVMNDQRKVVYEQRREIMLADDIPETIADMQSEVISELVAAAIPHHSYAEQWNLTGLRDSVRRVFALDLPIETWGQEEGIAESEIAERLTQAVGQMMQQKFADVPDETAVNIKRMMLLQTLDHLWKEHLLHLDYLRQGINLRAYGQRDPLNEYKNEAFSLFQNLLLQVREQTITILSHINFTQGADIPQPRAPQQMIESRNDPALAALIGLADESGLDMPDGMVMAPRAAAVRFDVNDPTTWGKVQRNADCPCGSGKKYKHCHGAVGSVDAVA